MRVRILAFLLIFGLTAIVYGDDRPAWLTSLPDHPDQIQGIGVAQGTGNAEEDWHRADLNAFADVMSQIRVTVSSTLTSYYEETDGDAGGTLTSSVVSKVSESYTNETLEGITVRDRYHDKKLNLFYTYATISQLEVRLQFERKAAMMVKLCRDYLHLSDDAIESGDIYAAISHLSTALREVLVAQAFLQKKVVGDLNGDGSDVTVQVQLEDRLSRIIGDLGFEILAGDNQKAVRGQGMEEPLRGRILYQGSVPVRSLPLSASFVNAKGMVSRDVTTDQQGEFSFFVQNIEQADQATGLIDVRMDMDEFSSFSKEFPLLIDRLANIGTTFTFRIDVASSIKIFVQLFERVNGAEVDAPFTNGRLIRELVTHDFTVVDPSSLNQNGFGLNSVALSESSSNSQIAEVLKGGANYAIVGTIHSVTSDSMYYGNPMVFARASADVRVIDVETERVVTNAAVSEVKGSGHNSRKANRSAIEECGNRLTGEILKGLGEALQ